MFSKTAKPEKASVKSDASLSAQSNDPARKTPRPASLISEDITIEGSIAGEGDLHVDGVIRGDIRIGHLTIGETGHIEGSIQAETVEARGRIIGALTAKQVRLHATAYVDGDITHEQLSVETGAFFQGRSLKFQRPAPVALAAPEEAKSA
jgi:cytoskeletal protein CcmA (bactofilin family)